MENTQLICPSCHQPIKPEYYFCPNCGANLKEKTAPISVWAQIGIYALSIFLPPLGLWPGIKYIMKKDKQAKTVGIIAVALTLVSSLITIWLIYGEFKIYLGTLQQSLQGL